MKNYLAIQSVEVKSLMYAMNHKDKLPDGLLDDYANGLIDHVINEQSWNDDDIKQFNKNAINGFYPALDHKGLRDNKQAFSNNNALLFKCKRETKNKLKDMPTIVRDSPIQDIKWLQVPNLQN